MEGGDAFDDADGEGWETDEWWGDGLGLLRGEGLAEGEIAAEADGEAAPDGETAADADGEGVVEGEAAADAEGEGVVDEETVAEGFGEGRVVGLGFGRVRIGGSECRGGSGGVAAALMATTWIPGGGWRISSRAAGSETEAAPPTKRSRCR